MGGWRVVLDPRTLCDLEAEQAVLGACLLDAAAADECLAILRPEAFYREGHRRIWRCMARLRGDRRGLDVLTVSDALQAAGDLEAAGGVVYLSDLTAAVPSTANAPEYAQSVAEAHVRRELVRAARDAAETAADAGRNIAEVREAVLGRVARAAESTAAAERPATLADVVAAAYVHVGDVHEGSESAGIGTGIGALDRVLGGLRRGELVVLGGRPSVGKSSLAQEIATAVAATGGPVLFASAEMPRRTIGLRALASEAGVDGRRLRGSPRMDEADWSRLGRAVTALQAVGQRLWIDDRSRTVPDIVAQARRLHAESPLALVVIDHLQHLRSPRDSENRNQAIGAMATACKDLATGCNCAVLALSQLNRQAPSQDRRPRLHDLRESGAIEQVADVVLLLHREAEDPPPPVCQVDCAIAKERNGETGKVRLWHERPTGRWYDNPQLVRRQPTGA